MKEQGLTRMVTLWHWTLPQWLADKGGFETKEGIEAFGRYAWFVAQNLGKEIDLWVTLNEPEVYAMASYKRGHHPPFKKNLLLTRKVVDNLIEAHKAGYRAIKQALGPVPIGIAKNFAYFEAYGKNNLLDRLTAYIADRIGNHYFLQKIEQYQDFIGLNYYFYNRCKFSWRHGMDEMNRNFTYGQMKLDDQLSRSDMGWVLHPEGIYHLLLDLKTYKKPIYITENGLADAADTRRPKFLSETLSWLTKALDQGVDLRGYFHWSLTDNYEWHDGFGPRFGLIEVNYATQERKIRPSAEIFKEIKFN